MKRAKVYISVYSMQDGEIIKICDNYCVNDNKSIIISPQNTVSLTKMGQLWVDEDHVVYGKIITK